MLRISGRVIRGEGDASKNHKILIPQLAQHFPEIANCGQFGTINVALEAPFFKRLADHWTPRVTWRPCWLGPGDPDCHEAFGFLRIRFACPAGGRMHNAWIIVPEWCVMSYEDFRVEVIADELLSGVAVGCGCAVELDEWPTNMRPEWFGKGNPFAQYTSRGAK
jgi:hypothetical protein